MQRSGAASLFFSYSHKDEALRDQLEVHLSMLKRQGLIDVWHDRRISPGEDLNGTISAYLESSDVILLLVSPDFLASSYCYDTEMTRAMQRHQTGEAIVIPVILRPCDWHGAPFGQLLATPTDGKPITLWANVDQAFLDVVTAIKSVLDKRGNAPAPFVSRPVSAAASTATSAPANRSSNLRITKQFSELERDQFLHDAFEYIAKFFQASLAELSRRSPVVEYVFRPVDANRFTAAVYRNGQAAARCSVFLGSGLFSRSSSTIAYSNNDSASTNSFNESLSVTADDQSLFLQALLVSSSGRRNEQGHRLSMQGGAELLWGMFIEPLQRA